MEAAKLKEKIIAEAEDYAEHMVQYQVQKITFMNDATAEDYEEGYKHNNPVKN